MLMINLCIIINSAIQDEKEEIEDNEQGIYFHARLYANLLHDDKPKEHLLIPV